MKNFEDHENLWETLKDRLIQGTLPSSLLFLGPEGIGKSLVATHLSSALLCPFSQNGNPCHHCPTCQKIKSDNHPDLTVLFSENSPLKIESIRKLRHETKHLPYEGKNRVFLIRDAHQMNLSASNALLKILEEPPANHHFILTSHAAHRLLPTILSRCQKFYFSPLKAEILQKILNENGATHFPPHWLELGSPGLILKWLENISFLQHPLWKTFFKTPQKISVKDLLDFSMQFKKCENPKAFLQWLQFNVGRKLKTEPSFAWMEFSDKIVECVNLAAVNINPSLSMEYLLTHFILNRDQKYNF